MENKYFTPGEEDIRIGYECEVLHGEDWETYTVTVPTALMWTIGDLKDKKLRVPFLSNEQIEKEGWEKRANGYHYEDWVIKHDKLLNRIIVIHNPTHLCKYEGQCKDINTFKYIIKLLNIK